MLLVCVAASELAGAGFTYVNYTGYVHHQRPTSALLDKKVESFGYNMYVCLRCTLFANT
jgi:hypothetical protein